MRAWLLKLLVLAVTSFALVGVNQRSAFAQSLQIQPLLYRESFKPGEVKKGFINVSNGGASTVTLVTEVKAFKQVDDQGTLQFFDSLQASQAITPDLQEFELKPREALRLYFAVDSKKLPGGDNFAALFVRTKGNVRSGVVAANVRVGTLMVIENGQPGPREAAITDVNGKFFQWGGGVEAEVLVKNTADPAKTTAFFPSVRASLKPFGGNTMVSEPPASPLIFAGITRKIDVSIPANVIGVYRLDVTAGQNTDSRWVVLVTGWWRWVVIAALIVGPALLSWWWLNRLKQQSRYKRD